MKKLATKLLVCSLACSLLVNPVRASAVDWEKFLNETDVTEEKVSSVSVELGTSDLENIIEKAVANSVDKSVEKSMEKAALKVARDKKSVQNIVNESKKTRKGSILWKVVKLPFSAAWTVVKSAFVLTLTFALWVGVVYASSPSFRETATEVFEQFIGGEWVSDAQTVFQRTFHKTNNKNRQETDKEVITGNDDQNNPNTGDGGSTSVDEEIYVA